MPIGDFVNLIPAPVFLLIHLVLFAAGAYFAWRSFEADVPLLGWGFSLFAAAELNYMTYHLDWTVFLFAHTISEVLSLAAFSLIFAGVSRGFLARLGGAEGQA
jgi:ABC-type microcin C transport system permease subunit YejB